jgi:hypothetical protein
MADFSILQPMPNFAQAALSGYQAGQQIRKQQQMDAALQGLDLSRPETVIPLIRSDPQTGTALLGVSQKIHAENRAMEQAKNMADVFRNLGGQDGASPLQAPTLQSGDGQAPAQTRNLNEGIAALLDAGASMEDAQKFVGMIGKMDEAQAKRVQEQQNALGTLAASIPPEATMGQRLAIIKENRDYLLSHGVPAQQIDTFVPNDQNLARVKNMALGVEKAMQFERQARQDAETQRHNRVSESQGAAHVSIAQQNANTQSGALGLARQKESRAAQKGANVSGMTTEELLDMARGK